MRVASGAVAGAARVLAGRRAFSTTRGVLVSERGKRQAQQKKDEELRRAVALYHLTPSFFPTPESGPEYSEELDDAVTDSILGPFQGERDGRPFVQFATTNELMNQHAHAVRSGRSDTLGELDLYDASRIRRMISMGDAAVQADADAAAGVAGGPPAAEELGDKERMDETLRMRQHFVNPPSGYTSRRTRDAAVYGDLYSNEEMSTRSAQVRDALFGTVAGELPGLEIVREREQEWAEQEGNDEEH